MIGARRAEALRGFEHDVIGAIPLAAAMQIRVAAYDSTRLVLAAPFASCRNHTGIAFGGAIECLGTLACWGWLWLTLADPGLGIVVQRAETEFRAPLTSELRAVARAPEAEEWHRFRNRLARHASARIEMTADIGDAGRGEGARFRGRFVAARPTSG